MGMHSRGFLEIPMPQGHVEKGAEEPLHRSAAEHASYFRQSNSTDASENSTSTCDTTPDEKYRNPPSYATRNSLRSLQNRLREAKIDPQKTKAALLEPLSIKARVAGWLSKTSKMLNPNIPLHVLYSSKLIIDNKPKTASTLEEDKKRSREPFRETDIKPPFDAKISNDESQTSDTKAMGILDLYSSDSFFENDSDSDTGPPEVVAGNLQSDLQMKESHFKKDEGEGPTFDLYPKELLCEEDSDLDIVMVKFKDQIDDNLQNENITSKDDKNAKVGDFNSSESRNDTDESPECETPTPNDDPTDVPPEIMFELKLFPMKMKAFKRKLSSERRRRNAEERCPGPGYWRSTRGRGRNAMR